METGTKKFRNPFQIGKDIRRQDLEIQNALAAADWKVRRATREVLATNEEIQLMADKRDAHNEMWTWGLFAIILHRRYRFTSRTIESILAQVQQLHNELYDGSVSQEECTEKIYNLVKEETGLTLLDDDMEALK